MLTAKHQWLKATVPGKCKLTVPRNLNDSTRSSILETPKFRVLRFKLRAWSFESRTSSFESRTSSFETRNKEFFARLMFHATLRRTAMAVILGALKSRQGLHTNEVASVALLFFIAFIFIFRMISLLKAKFVIKFLLTR